MLNPAPASLGQPLKLILHSHKNKKVLGTYRFGYTDKKHGADVSRTDEIFAHIYEDDSNDD